MPPELCARLLRVSSRPRSRALPYGCIRGGCGSVFPIWHSAAPSPRAATWRIAALTHSYQGPWKRPLRRQPCRPHSLRKRTIKLERRRATFRARDPVPRSLGLLRRCPPFSPTGRRDDDEPDASNVLCRWRTPVSLRGACQRSSTRMRRPKGSADDHPRPCGTMMLAALSAALMAHVGWRRRGPTGCTRASGPTAGRPRSGTVPTAGSRAPARDRALPHQSTAARATR